MLLKVDITYTWEDGRVMDSVLMKTKEKKRRRGGGNQWECYSQSRSLSVFGLGA